MHSREIPSTGIALPVVGVGTYVGFDVEPGGADYRQLQEVLSALFAAGGSVIDSSPMYGRAEAVAGQLLAESGERERAFLATKVWVRGKPAGIAQMEESFELLRAKTIDLMQVHNLLDWQTHLPVLRQWQAQGRFRHIGVSHYTPSAYPELEKVLRAERLDFLQVNYSAQDREAEQRILPLAAERGIAVLVNMPFGGGGLLRSLRGKPLPSWADEWGCSSWAQLLLKYVLGHAAVTCVIPGTGNPRHMRENAAAGSGLVLDEGQRRKVREALS